MAGFNAVDLPKIKLSAGFGAAPSSVCVRGSGVRDTNTRGGVAMVDLPSDDIVSITITRGRASPIDAVTPGIAEIVLDNASGNYDPTNLSGTYVSAGVSLVDIGAPVTIQAEYPVGMFYDRFTGELVDIAINAGNEPRVTLTCADGLEKLGRVQLPVEVAQFDNDTSGQRINHLADRAGWPATARAIDQGTITLNATTLGASALELTRRTEQSEFGLLFVDGAGTLTFYDRHRSETANRSVIVQAALTDTAGPGEVEMLTLTLAKSRERVYNDVHVTRDVDPLNPDVAPVEQVAQDPASIAKYGTLSLPASVGTLLASDADALNLAEGLVDLFAAAQVRIREVDIDATTLGLWSTLLPLRLLDRIRVSRDYGPNTITGQLLIQASREEITDAPSWRFTFSTSEPPSPVAYCTRGAGLRDTNVRGW